GTGNPRPPARLVAIPAPVVERSPPPFLVGHPDPAVLVGVDPMPLRERSPIRRLAVGSPDPAVRIDPEPFAVRGERVPERRDVGHGPRPVGGGRRRRGLGLLSDDARSGTGEDERDGRREESSSIFFLRSL